jgi:twitching motility protein PilT
MTIEQLMGLAYSKKASDIHILSDLPPILRINGVLCPVASELPLRAEDAKELVVSMLTEEQKELLDVNKEIDFSLSYGQKSRFRVNAYVQKGSVAASMRQISLEIKTIEELNLPQFCHRIAELRQGFVLVTGPTGHGKSTTLAAIINEINKNRPCHIITIEDPIEFVFTPKKAIISQRELRYDTHSWEIALRSVLREDPDVVLVGEMRDFETISAALTIAETGHLVLATLHTNSASQTIDRVVDVFPDASKAQVRMQLASTLEAVFSQRLIPAIREGRVPAVEIMVGTTAVRTAIRELKTHMLDNIIQTSGGLGMVTLEASLANLVIEGKVALEVASSYALKPEELIRLVRSK